MEKKLYRIHIDNKKKQKGRKYPESDPHSSAPRTLFSIYISMKIFSTYNTIKYYMQS